MDFSDRIKLVNRIITGFMPVIYLGTEYHIYDSIPKHDYLSDFYYDEAYHNMLMDGVLSESESLDILKEKNIWKDEFDKELDRLVEERKKLLLRVSQCQYKSNEKRSLEYTLAAIEKKYKKLQSQKLALLLNTREYLARVEKFKKILFYNTYIDNKLLWKEWSDFEEASDKLIYFLLQKTYLSEGITEGVIRELARTDPWRTFWKAALKTGNLLGKPIIEFTDYQRLICSWSGLYDNIYESPDCPADDVINNDILLDAWLLEQQKKREKDHKPTVSNSRIANASEIGIVVDSPEDAQKVYELNDPATLGKIRSREKYVATKGETDEINLPDVQNELRMKLNKMATEQAKRK